MKTNTKITFFLLILFFLNPFNYGFAFGYLLFAYQLFIGNLFYNGMKPISITLLICTLTYAAFYSFDPVLGSQFIFLYAIIPYTFLTCGRFLALENKEELIPKLFLLGFILSLPSLISVLLSIQQEGFITIERDVPNIWTGEPEPATNTAGALILNMCIPALLIIRWKFFKKNVYSILALVIFALSVTCVLRLGSRTHLVIAVFTVFVASFYKMTKQGAIKNAVLIGAIFIVSNLAFTYFTIDKDSDILSAYADRMDSKKHGAATAGGRLWKWERSTELIFEKPLGWRIDEIGLAHNLWFDVARVGGIISFGFLLVFTLKVFQKVMTIAYRKPMSVISIPGILLIYLVGFYLLFFVEPIMEGYFNCFVLFCVVAGSIVELARIQYEGVE